MIRYTILAEKLPHRRVKLRLAPAATVEAVQVERSEIDILGRLPGATRAGLLAVVRHSRFIEAQAELPQVKDVAPKGSYKLEHAEPVVSPLDAT